MQGTLENTECKNKTKDCSSQVYGVATYDSLFKWVLATEEIQTSFFSACIPGLQVSSSERLDNQMNPLKELEKVRHSLHKPEFLDTAKNFQEQEHKLEVFLDGKHSKEGTKFLQIFLFHFEDIRKAFPRALYDGSMDFLCRLDNGDLALVEMQITPQDNWENRALAYVAATYCRQLKEGMQWGDIRTVIGINLLGGGLNEDNHWEDTPGQYIRHYKLQEQINGENPPRFVENMQLVQYSLANLPLEGISVERKEWLTFFRNGHNMTEQEVEQTIETPAVRAAFERTRLDNLPVDVMNNYEKEKAVMQNISIHVKEKTEEGIKIGEERGEARGIKIGEERGIKIGEERGIDIGEKRSERSQIIKRLSRGHPIEEIAEDTGWSIQDIQSIENE